MILPDTQLYRIYFKDGSYIYVDYDSFVDSSQQGVTLLLTTPEGISFIVPGTEIQAKSKLTPRQIAAQRKYLQDLEETIESLKTDNVHVQHTNVIDT